ncbi:phage holin [Rummeliibacillus pycnus]|uniref:phage holin n=1 Tax=Rummeliibacillus pycnus TaxID=101070 RepID=UPI001FE5F0AF|nr:phage holin [Rummeliibacillus pycnus]
MSKILRNIVEWRNTLTADKLKQIVALFGGLLSAILLFLRSIGVTFDWFSQESINAFNQVLLNGIPFVLVIYGVWKNSYIVTKKAKEQEKLLKEKGLK